MSRVRDVLSSSIGSKALVAVTGIMLFLFLIAHLLGDLLVFAGPDAINAYGHGLRQMPYGAIWLLRGGLLVTAVAHFWIAIRLSLANRAARPIAYHRKATVQASRASLNMIWTGLALLFFLIYHLLHFTFKFAGSPIDRTDNLGRTDVYAMVIDGFHHPAIALSYIGAMVFLALHLSHGLSSLFQTLGQRSQRFKAPLNVLGPALSSAMALAYISIPVAIWLGFLGP